MRKPAVFLVRHACLSEDLAVWAVKQGRRWRYYRDVTIQVTVATERTPEGECLAGVGVVQRRADGSVVITA